MRRKIGIDVRLVKVSQYGSFANGANQRTMCEIVGIHIFEMKAKFESFRDRMRGQPVA